MRSYFPKSKYLLLLIFIILSGVIYIVIEHLKQKEIETYKNESYRENISSTKIYLTTLIKEKQNATTTIALGLSVNENIIEAFRARKSTGVLLKDLSKQLADKTDFKNVWFQIVTKDGVSLERTWTDVKNDSIIGMRKDLQKALQEKTVVSAISIGKFDLNFKTIVPIFDPKDKKILGVLEVMTHFNSISTSLENKKVSAVVLADKIYKKQLTHPFTKMFIGEYYVANKNIKQNLFKYFQTINMEKYLEHFKTNDYFIDSNLNSMVSYYNIHDSGNNKKLGHILLIQDVNNFDANDINYINYIYNIYFLFAIIALLLIVYLSANIEIKDIVGKSHSLDLLFFIIILYLILSIGIYNILKLKYDGDVEHYNQTIKSQTLIEYNFNIEKNKEISNLIYDEIVNKPKVIDLFIKRDREELYNLLHDKYKEMGLKYDIRQLHFFLPDTVSFLRMHKREFFGDSLVGVRESIEYVNETHKPFYGFEEGRIYNGFRHVYPLFDKDGGYIGGVEVSFDMKSFIDGYSKHFDAKRTDFYISEKIMKGKVFASEQSGYIKSPIDEFLFDKVTLDKMNIDVAKNIKTLATQEQFDEISKKIKLGVPFTIHFEEMNEVAIFIPIINKISGEVVGCLSVLKDDNFIKHRFDELQQVMIVVMIVMIFIMFFIYREFLSKKRAQVELANNQKILDSQKSFIIITDGVSIKRVNQSFLLFFGFPNLEAFKEEHDCVCDFFSYEKGKDYLLKEMNGINWFEYLKTSLHNNSQVKMYDKNNQGHIFYLEVNFEDALEDGNYIVTFVDITHLKNIEDQLFYSEKMASLGNMIGNIAHQWRQPLSVISTCASGLSMKHEYGILKDEDIEPNMEMIVENTKYLSETIDTFRDFVKESNEKEHKKVSIGETIATTLSIMEASLKNNYIDITFDEGSESYYKTMAKGEFAQVITNLINNAKDVLLERKIENPAIKIELQRLKNRLIITVEDNGGGISDDIIKNVFEPYFTTKHKSKGTGLGLYICHKIITESLGGEIYVKNGEYGAKFFIELPLD